MAEFLDATGVDTALVAADAGLDVVVRFHDIGRLRELERCVFSLAGQSYRPLRIILATQRFSDRDLALVREALRPLIEAEPDLALSAVNWDQPEPADARSVLLNEGVAAARGRYLAFLDYDDVLYPDAYTLLIGRLQTTGAAIAFASVHVMRLQVYDSFFYTSEAVVPPFSGKTLLDLFRNNFCPLHSYVIDRAQVAPEILSYSPSLLMEEDYDVLLRICARYPSDFELIGTDVGNYYYKSDGSNTVPIGGTFTPQSELRYKGVRAAIDFRKRTTPVSERVQRALGLPQVEGLLSIYDVVEQYA